jgi:hypothetical protein
MTSEKISKNPSILMITYCKFKINAAQWGCWGEQRKTLAQKKARFSKFSKTFFFSAKFCGQEMLVFIPH